MYLVAKRQNGLLTKHLNIQGLDASSLLGLSGKRGTKNAGYSHDVVENKRSKKCQVVTPTMLMKTQVVNNLNPRCC